MDDKTVGIRRDWSTESTTAATRIHPLGRDEPPPLSYSQQQLCLDRHSSSSRVHHVAARLRLRGKVDRQALRRALELIVARHKVLRTTFPSIEGEPTRVCQLPDAGFPLVEQEAESHEEAVEQISRQEALDPFDLSVGPLIRGRLLQLSEDEHVLLITAHRLASDSSSMSLLLRELSTLYNAFTQGRSNPLPPLELQYVDYANWQRQHITIDVLNRQLEFWTQTLRGVPILTQLPTDHPRGSLQHCARDRVRLKLSTALAKRLVQFARQHRVSLFVTLLSGWAVLLARWCGLVEVVIGTRVSKGQPPEAASLIGSFENTLALRICMRQDPTVEQLLKHVRAVVADAYAHQDVPFDKVLDALDPIRSSAPLPQLNVAMNDIAAMDCFEAQLAGLKVTEVSVATADAQFELSLSMSDGKEGLTATLEYASHLFERKTVERIAAWWHTLLKGMVKHPRRPITRVAMLPSTERDRVLYRFNETAAAYPHDRLIHELFEEQVERTPDAVAVVCEQQSLTYAELNGRANQLARYLVERGLKIGEYVPILMSRSLQLLVAELAVLKSGGAYVPLDPTLPLKRQVFIIRDCRARQVLAEQAVDTDVAQESIRWVDVTEVESVTRTFPPDNLRSQGDASGPAYVMYTSGSTGEPKGVVVPHRAVNRLVINNRYAQIESTDCIAHCSNPAFDASTFEIWGALLNGARVLIVPQSVVLDASRFAKLLRQERVTVLWLTVGLFTKYTEALADVFGQLRYLLTGGDVVEPTAIRRVLRRSSPRHLINAYGPTECTTFSTTYRIEAVEDDTRSIPIGRPISNTCIYILDRHLQPVPIGVPGEIYIGGPGVALGYLNRPKLTRERFIADPFTTDSEARLYKSGDLGRWLADGNIEFLGRNDQQVKIRGFRIELGEIERRLAEHGNVTEAVVIAREDIAGEKRLVAYVTSSGNRRPSAEALRAHLTELLPDYMVPSAYVLLENLPLTPNGKLDRQALPAPELGAYIRRQYEAPQGGPEETLTGIWQKLLKVERVGRRDNFFELGGHSLLIVQMMDDLRRVGLSVRLNNVYENPTVAELVRTLSRESELQFEVPPNLIPPGCQVITPKMLPLVDLQNEEIELIVQRVPGGVSNTQDIYPLAPLQEGILFHHLLNQQSGDAYVLPTLLSLSSRERLEDLIRALQAVIDRHDVLRTAILWEQLSRPVQVVHRNATLPVQEVTLDPDRDATEQIDEWLKPERQRLDLRRAPLMCLTVAVDPDGTRWHALLQTHHLVCDNVSLEILLSEVIAYVQGRTHEIPEAMPYRDHVAQILALAQTDDAEAFFRSKLGEVDEPTAPFGLMNVYGDGQRIDEVRQPLELELARRIRVQARRLGVGAATLFHAAWALVIARTSGRDDVVFGTVLLGRLHGSAGSQRVLGMFINTLPLRLQLQNLTADELVRHTQRELVELLNHEQASLAVAQRSSAVGGAAPLFSALMNYRHSVTNPVTDWSAAAGVQVIARRDRTNYPITLSVDDLGEQFELTVKTERQIDPHRTLSYVHTTMQSLVQALEQASQTPALALSVLPESERRQVLERFNATCAVYPQEKLIHELFELQVQCTPQALAVVYQAQSLTYAELNSRANQLARYLRARDVGPDCLVGLCSERSLDMVVGLLGILKAGGAFVPLDPDYPPERLAYVLEDAAPVVLLTQQHLRERLPQTAAELVSLDRDWGMIAANDSSNLDSRAVDLRSDHLAYVIYTSGSTGQPKGVMIEHRQVASLWQGLEHLYRRSAPCQRVGVNASFSFDASVKQFIQLLSGRTLVLVPQQVRLDAPRLVQFLDENRIEGIDCTPSQLRAWIDAGLLKRKTSPLRIVLVGGEAIDAELWSHLAQCAETDFYNVYGPTESTVDTTATCLNGDASAPHIGRPMENRRVYLLDHHGRPVPIGVAGEIYIGGAGVGRGYLRRPELTAQRFVADPFSADPQARLYKTGDVGCWRADGTIEYLRRNDDQVKIRGFRIEPGETEAHLVQHEKVKEAVVVARESVRGEWRLVAYLTQSGDSTPNVEELRNHLKAVLPEFMVPSAFVILESLPLTPSGKLDRRALPTPSLEAFASEQYETPQSEIETLLAAIWQELLRVERVGRHANFFALGGHSLLAMQMIVRIRSSLSIEVPIGRLFKYPTLRQFAADVDALLQARLFEEVMDGGNDVEELLERVAAMPDSKVRELVKEMTTGEGR